MLKLFVSVCHPRVCLFLMGIGALVGFNGDLQIVSGRREGKGVVGTSPLAMSGYVSQQ